MRCIRATLAVVLLLIICTPAWAQKQQDKHFKNGKPIKEARAEGSQAHGPIREFAAVTAAIDREIDKGLTAAGVAASPDADDAEFLRRVTIDIVGRIPTLEDATAFLASSDADKRGKRIDELLDDPGYGQHFRDIWRGLIDPKSDAGARKVSELFNPWLAEQFNANRPWSEMVYAMLTAEGDISQIPETGFIMAQSANAQPQPDQLAKATSRLFLGVRLECAECHDHPFASWKQTDFWATAAFFTQVRNSDPKGGQRNARLLDVADGGAPGDGNPSSASMMGMAPAGGIMIPGTAGKGGGTTVRPRFLLSPEPVVAGPAGYRKSLAKWVTSPDNRFFAQAAVNRMWAHFFARGLFNPIDDFPVDGPRGLSHPELLALLSREFTTSGFDLKHLIRAICNSRTYQRTSRPVAGNESNAALFSHVALKTLTPEVLYDSIVDMTGVSQLKPVNPGRKGSSKDPRVIFTELFRTQGDGADPGALGYGIPQFLRRMNAAYFNDGSAFLKQLGTARMTSEQAIGAIYLATLSRRPTADELRLMSDYVARRESPEQGYAGVLWILLNSGEFVLNH